MNLGNVCLTCLSYINFSFVWSIGVENSFRLLLFNMLIDNYEIGILYGHLTIIEDCTYHFLFCLFGFCHWATGWTMHIHQCIMLIFAKYILHVYIKHAFWFTIKRDMYQNLSKLNMYFLTIQSLQSVIHSLKISCKHHVINGYSSLYIYDLYLFRPLLWNSKLMLYLLDSVLMIKQNILLFLKPYFARWCNSFFLCYNDRNW